MLSCTREVDRDIQEPEATLNISRLQLRQQGLGVYLQTPRVFHLSRQLTSRMHPQPHFPTIARSLHIAHRRHITIPASRGTIEIPPCRSSQHVPWSRSPLADPSPPPPRAAPPRCARPHYSNRQVGAKVWIVELQEGQRGIEGHRGAEAGCVGGAVEGHEQSRR